MDAIQANVRARRVQRVFVHIVCSMCVCLCCVTTVWFHFVCSQCVFTECILGCVYGVCLWCVFTVCVHSGSKVGVSIVCVFAVCVHNVCTQCVFWGVC